MNVLFSLPIRPRMRLLRGSDIPAFSPGFSGGFVAEQKASSGRVFGWGSCRLSCSGLWIYVVAPSARQCIAPHLRCPLSCGVNADCPVVIRAPAKIRRFPQGIPPDLSYWCSGRSGSACAEVSFFGTRQFPVAADTPRPCPEGFPFTPFSAIRDGLSAPAIKKMKNAAFETAIIQYRMLSRCIPQQKEGVRYLAVANPSG